MPTCRKEMILISNLRAQFCAKHDFTVTKHTHTIKLSCENVVKTFSSKVFFSILATKYFSILKYFSQFWNIFYGSGILFSILNFFFSIPKNFSPFKIFFLDSVIFSRFHNFIFDSEISFWIPNFFSQFWKFVLHYESFFSILKVFSWCRLSATIIFRLEIRFLD